MISGGAEITPKEMNRGPEQAKIWRLKHNSRHENY